MKRFLFVILTFLAMSCYGNIDNHDSKLLQNTTLTSANDAGISQIVWPLNNVLAGSTHTLKVALHNYGSLPLTSVVIHWQFNNQMNSINWTGNLASLGTDTVSLGTMTFPPGFYYYRAWTSLPNNTTDLVPSNDSSSVIMFRACLSGNYTIGDTLGGANHDFVDFTSAINALYSGGICDSVVFRVDSGVYNESVILPPIIGAGPNSTITFTSMSGDSTDVKLIASLSSLQQNTLQINGAYYSFKKITVSVFGSTNYGTTVSFTKGSRHIVFSNCEIEGSSTSSNNGVIVANDTNINYITFKNNRIKYGYQAIHFSGTNSVRQIGNTFIGNTIDSRCLFYYQQDFLFKGNRIINNNLSVFSSKDIKIIGNNMDGLGVSGCDVLNQSENIIASNFIHYYNPFNVYGGKTIYINSCSHTSIVFNTVVFSGTNNSSSCCYLTYGNNIKLVNNIFINNAGGYAIKQFQPVTIAYSDYNIFYSSGINLSYWNGNHSSLSSFQTATGTDSNSINILPVFISSGDLHISDININGFATPYPPITTDIDGDIRDSLHPDIGADEFWLPQNDAGVVGINAPVSPVGSGNNSIRISLRNFGEDTLTSVTLAWKANNILQTPYSWTGNLASGAIKDSINIGTYNFTTLKTTLKIWSENPNSGIDGDNSNDTFNISMIHCSGMLHGIFTIGGSAADFPDFTSAINALNSCGVDSHLVFMVNPGIYNEQIEINSISGAGDTATITFQGVTGDSTDIKLRFSPMTNDNYVVYLNGADYISFKKMTIETYNSSIATNTIILNGVACHNTFSSCYIKNTNPFIGSSSCIFDTVSGNNSFNTFSGNRIEGGYFGVYMKGQSSYNREAGNVLKYNVIEDFCYCGLYLMNQDSVKVNHNIIAATGSTNLNIYSFYGIYINNCYQGFKLGYNDVTLTPGNGGVGIRVYGSQGSANNRTLIYNNFIKVFSGTYGIRVNSSTYTDILFNNIYTTGSCFSALSLYNGNNIKVLNNNIVNKSYNITNNPNPVMSVNPQSIISQCDYNNYKGLGTYQLIETGGINLSLIGWRLSSGKDANSLNVDPVYLSNKNLHVQNTSLNNSGITITGITDDIDGDIRSATPDIGADEFNVFQSDVKPMAVISPAKSYAIYASSQVLKVKIQNAGIGSVTSMDIGYIYGGGNPVVKNWTGVLNSGDSIVFTFPNPLTIIAGHQTLRVFTDYTQDMDHGNDTIDFKLTGQMVKNLSFYDDFEATNYWCEEGGLWQRGTPVQTNLNSTHSGSTAWMTGLSTNYPDYASAYLYSPVFNVSNISTATLKFYHKFSFNTNDYGNVEYSTDNGQSWGLLGYRFDNNGSNWYANQYFNSDCFGGVQLTWTLSEYNLTSILNLHPNTIQFRFHFVSDYITTNEGWLIDDFSIEIPKIQYDGGVTDVFIDSTAIASAVHLLVKVRNFGYDTLKTIPMCYIINNGTVVQNLWAISGAGLAQGDADTFTFITPYSSPVTDYSICAFTKISGDFYNQNDSLCKTIKTKPANFDAGISKIISPMDTIPINGANTVTVRIVNYGLMSLDSVNVLYKINNNNQAIETWSGTSLPYGDSVDFTFQTTYPSFSGMSFQLCAKTIVTGDNHQVNDEFCKSVLSGISIKSKTNEIKLWQNIPNPANGRNTLIKYEIPTNGMVHFELVNATGKIISSLDKNSYVGLNTLVINTSQLSNGIYFYSLNYKGYHLTKKMIINR